MRKADDFVASGALRVNPFTICMLGNFSCFCCRLLTFSKLSFSKNCAKTIIRVSNSLDPDQDRRSVLSVLILVQAVCKGYQQMTKVAASKERVKYQLNFAAGDTFILLFHDES